MVINLIKHGLVLKKLGLQNERLDLNNLIVLKIFTLGEEREGGGKREVPTFGAAKKRRFLRENSPLPPPLVFLYEKLTLS